MERKINGIKAGQVLARDLVSIPFPLPRSLPLEVSKSLRCQQKKRSAIDSTPKATTRDPCLEIDISGKQLTDEGFAQFADELIRVLDHEHESCGARLRLQELHLGGNELSAESLEKLARVVALSRRDLRELDLSANCIQVVTSYEREVWERFLHAFDECFVLKKLDLSGNPIGAAGVEIFARVYVRSEMEFVMDDEEATAGSDAELPQQSLGPGKENVKPNGDSPAQTPRRARKGMYYSTDCFRVHADTDKQAAL
ncbi:hypothetical protein VTN31DRAFT_5209 [Thermomyces dupontii]|uniref:uncharacterized protein n=1 Tax=Talaromyces thermophilus TaxID=28565 RepID=UPI00374310DA